MKRNIIHSFGNIIVLSLLTTFFVINLQLTTTTLIHAQSTLATTTITTPLDYLYMPIDGSLENKVDVMNTAVAAVVKTFGTTSLSSVTSVTGTTSALITNSQMTKSDYMEVQNVINFCNNDFIVEFSVYNTYRSGGYHGLFAINGLSTNYYLNVNADGTLFLFKPVTSGWDYKHGTSIKLPLNTWVQLKIERKENILSLYLNGQLVVAHSNPITINIPGETVNVGFGKSSVEGDNYSFVGFIDNIRIYNPNGENKLPFKVASVNNEEEITTTDIKSTKNITFLFEQKELFTINFINNIVKLNSLEKAYLLKQQEMNQLELVNSIKEDEGLKVQMNSAETQLTTINALVDELKLNVKMSGMAILKVDERISDLLVNSSIKFSVVTANGGDGLLYVKNSENINSDSIYGVGNNKYGNLGCGHSTFPVTAPCKTVIDNVLLKGKSISQIQSQGHTVILTTDNTLLSFGYGEKGALGDGRLQTSSIPVPVDNSLFLNKQIKQIEVGSGGAIILTTEGKVYGWGQNLYGELCSTGMKASPIYMSGSLITKKVKKVFYKMFTSAFLMEDGDVYICGRYPSSNSIYYSNFTKIDFKINLDPIDDIIIAYQSMFFRTRSGSLYAMGSNNLNTLGLTDSTLERNVPTLLSFFKHSNVVIAKACAGPKHVIALSTSGKVYQWGTQQINTGTTTENIASVPGLLTPSLATPFRFIGNEIENYRIIDIVCGGATNVAISDSGVVFSWGYSYLFASQPAYFSYPTRLILP